jgi:hypothetical protein
MIHFERVMRTFNKQTFNLWSLRSGRITWWKHLLLAKMGMSGTSIDMYARLVIKNLQIPKMHRVIVEIAKGKNR